MSKRPMTARDLFGLKIVNDPQVAPDVVAFFDKTLTRPAP